MDEEPLHNRNEAEVAEAPREPGIGQVLAEARAAQGLSLEDVANQLKFGLRQIEALEAERFDALPGGTFVRGMVRGYARLLKIDAKPLLARLEGKFDAPDADRLLARYQQPVPFSDNARRSNLAYAALSLVILAVVAAVAFQWRHERNSAARPTFVPAARAPLEPPRAAVASAAPAPVVLEAGAAESVTAPAVEPAPPAPAGRRIVMRFEEESWVEVRDSTGKMLLAQLNPAGSVRVVRGEPPFSLVIGNAQHVQVIYDDKPVDLKPYVKVEVARFRLE